MFSKIRFFFNGVNRKAKIITIVFCVVIFAVFMLIFTYMNSYVGKLREDAAKSALAALTQASMNIDNIISNVETLSNFIFVNEDTINLLRYKEGHEKNNQRIEELSDVWRMATYYENHNNILKVRFFVDSRKIISKERINIFALYESEEFPWYNDVIERNGSIVWYPHYSVNYLDLGWNDVVSCVRILNDYRNINSSVAIFSIDISAEVIYKILDNINADVANYAYILDENDRIIFSRDSDKIGETDDFDNEKTLDGIYKYQDDEGRTVIAKSISATNWKIVSKLPTRTLVTSASLFSDWLIVAIIVLLLLFLIISMIFAIFTEGVLNRISTLNRAIGGYYERDNIGMKNNSAPLFSKIDTMIYKTQNIIKENYEAKAKEREAQIRALQAQINPHFLYNTLDTIGWMIKMGDSNESSLMINALAKYFRLSLSGGKDVVCISDEIELARVYCQLQKNRFKDRFEIEFEIDDECLDYKIPKMVIQPIIENALIHGISKERNDFNVSVVVYKDGEYITISVMDNGIGMDSDKIDKILSRERSGCGYGIYNVNERIKLFSANSEEECGISIFSEVNKYTNVVVTIKARQDA